MATPDNSPTRGGLLTDPNTGLPVSPGIDWTSGHELRTPFSPDLSLQVKVFRLFAEAVEAGNSRPDLAEFAGQTRVERTDNPDYKGPLDGAGVIQTEKPSEIDIQLHKLKQRPLSEQRDYWSNRLITALDQNPDLKEKRLRGLMVEILNGRVEDGEDDLAIPNEIDKTMIHDFLSLQIITHGINKEKANPTRTQP